MIQYQSLSPNIGVESVDETVKFYTEFLGFKEILSVPVNGKLIWAMVNAGNVNLMFQDRTNLEEEYTDLKGKDLQSARTLYIKVKNMDYLYKQIVDTQYLVKTKHTTPYGAQEFAMKDNNGFILTITEDTIDESALLGYDNFFLPVDDFEKSKKYYSEVLGLKVKFEFAEQGMIAFQVGNEEPAIILKDKKKFKDVKPTIWIEVANVKALYKQMMDKGVQFITEPFHIRTGWAVEFTDPSGNVLGFTDYIKD